MRLNTLIKSCLLVVIACLLAVKAHAQTTMETLDEVLQLVEQSRSIDLLVLGPQLEAKLNDPLSVEEKSALLITLINGYFSDGFQNKFMGFAEQLEQHSKQHRLPEEAHIAKLFLLPRKLGIRFRSQAFFEQLQLMKNNLDETLDDRVLYQIDIMLTTLNPSSFKFSQQQALMNHIARVDETGQHQLYKFFFYKALATSHSQIDVILQYSKAMLMSAQAHQLPVNRIVMLHGIGYSFHFRRVTEASRKCVDLQLQIAQELGDPLQIFRAQSRELEQLNQEQNYPAMLELIERINAGDHRPSQHWRNFVDYYQAVAHAYTGQVELAQATYERLYEFLNSPELTRHNLPDYLKAHILYNQGEYEAAKQTIDDYWWHRYNHVLRQQEQHVTDIRDQFLTLVDEKTASIALANQRLTTFKWLSALLLLLFLVIVFLIIRTKKDAKTLAAQHQQLEQLSRIDDLTQLFNRRYFLQCLNDVFRHYQHNPQAAAALLMIDIDHFKSINDNHGHAVGDSVLEQVAQIITQHSPSNAICARYGGEEFLLLLQNTSAEQAYALAERLRVAIASHAINLADQTIHVTGSMGIAVYNKDAHDPNDWIQQADEAMYQSKRNGRNQSTLFEQ